MPQVVHESFDAKTVELQNSNLIEASAGTGKTFSIALLLIRLIVEKGIPIEKILMVTFTKAAVAELELRVRSFVRSALQNVITRNFAPQDDPVSIILLNAVATNGNNLVIERLKTATLFLDELAVMTIHSFCQKTLSEYSFETNQTFGAENMSPDEFSELTEDFFNQFWRKYITTLDLELLKELIGKGLSRETLLKQVQSIIRGQKTIGIEFQADSFDFTSTKSVIDEIIVLKSNVQTIQEEIILELTKNKPKYLQSISLNKSAVANFEQLYLDDAIEGLVQKIKEKSDNVFCKKIFNETILPLLEQKAVAETEFSNRLILIISQIGEIAAAEVNKNIKDAKKVKGFITFDDMIELLHEAVVLKYNPTLKEALRDKYQAVFIDEFQDTDKLQYGIFNTLFGDNHTLFYIGDPKQSIYGFRKADINTYLKASQEVDNLYRMNTNFRSNAVFIESMNCFFKPTPEFDTFALGTPPPFEYISVNSPANNQKGYLMKNGITTKTLSISTHQQKKGLYKGVVSTVIQLLNKDIYKIREHETTREVKPSDIGIVVRTNNEGRAIKEWLSKFRIPAITVDDSKLLSSDEAKELCYILEAVNTIEQGAINKALLTKIAGYSIDQLLVLNEEEILARFRQYQDDWKEKGVFVMLKEFISDHELSSRLLRVEIDNGERLVSNILQLIEIINNVEVKKQLDKKELIQWLKKGIEGNLNEGDEFEQRIESDADAIKIVTIHKCKGLEYNIVLAPSLDLLPSSPNHTTISFRNPDDSFYYNIDKKLASEAEITWASEQAEQENRRLLYVAITRARMQCFIYANVGKYYVGSCLRKFITALNVPTNDEIEMDAEHWEKWVPKEIDYSFRYFSEANKVATNYATISTQTLPLLHPNWRKTSYSGLNPEHTATIYPNNTVVLDDEYEKFAFRDLKKGAHTGNLLHYIFENLNFNNTQYWDSTINKALNRVFAINNDNYVTHINQLLTHVTEVSLPMNALHPTNKAFSLKELTNQNKLNELEFDFPLKPFNTDKLVSLSTEAIPFQSRSFTEIEGIMNGKMDLFFLMNDKYYILDWKSNYLGDTLEDYNEEKVAAAMGINNYHLQYHLYTVSAKKYLNHCIKDFDYERDFGGVIYVFLRGVRVDSKSGLFLHRPTKEIIEKFEGIMS